MARRRIPLDPWVNRVVDALAAPARAEWSLPPEGTAGVLFLIQCPDRPCHAPILLLNKRSSLVRQPGDLCCPGGRVIRFIDPLLGILLSLPISLLKRSSGWRTFAAQDVVRRRNLAMHWACSLRESWEEMGLLPWTVDFLGILPLYRLRLFERRILPMVGFIRGHGGFRPNWEVERIVPIPMDTLLRSENYGSYLLRGTNEQEEPLWDGPVPYPCFIHEDEHGREILWGATYQIVISFLERVYGFQPPPMGHGPVVHGSLTSHYLTGQKTNRTR